MGKEREKELLSHLVHAHHKIERQQSCLERLESEGVISLVKLQYAALTPQERKRIVAGWKAWPWTIYYVSEGERMKDHFYKVVSALLDIHEDTVRLVLSEEGE